MQCFRKGLIAFTVYRDHFIFSHSVCKKNYRIICRSISVYGNHIVCIIDIITEGFLKCLFCDCCICCDKAEHGAHIRMDHTRSFCHTTDGNGLSGNLDLYCDLFFTGISRHDCFCCLSSVCQCIIFLFSKSLYPCHDAINWKLLSDDTGRSDQYTVCINSKSFCCHICCVLAVAKSFRTGTCIGNSGIDDHSLCFRTTLYNLLIPFYARCLYNVCSKCSCTFTWNLAVDHCHVGSVLIFDLCCC